MTFGQAFLFCLLRSGSPGELDVVGVMNETIEDGVCVQVDCSMISCHLSSGELLKFYLVEWRP